MNFKIDASALTPLEVAALEDRRNKREDMDDNLTAAQVLEQLTGEALAGCVDAYLAEQLPTLTTLGKLYLNASPEKQNEARALIGFADPKQGEAS